MNTSKTKTRVILSVLHGVALFIVLWVINSYTSYSASFDEALLKKIFVLEELVLPAKFTVPHDFTFVNVSRDISLIDNPENYGQVSITDRNKLASFLELFADNNNQHRFMLCDIFFEYPSNADSALLQQISRCNRLLFPFHYSNGKPLKPCINVPSALADYQTYSDNFSRFRLVYEDSIETIPMVLYKQLHKVKTDSRVTSLGTIAPRYYIRPYHLFVSNKYPYFNLGELLQLSAEPSFYQDYLENKFIVVGDFESKSDEHETPIGNLCGALILVDTYLSLAAGRANITIGWILFMVAALSATSYLLFFKKIKPPRFRVSPWIDFIIHHVLNRVFSLLAICVFIVFISELVFSIQLFISPVFLYLVYISWAMEIYSGHFKNQQK